MGVVFQYGSNTCNSRLNAPSRLRGDAKSMGLVSVEDYDLCFNVYSVKNQCAASNIYRLKGKKVWGVLYEIPDGLIRGKPRGRPSLQQIEGDKYHEEPVFVVKPGGQRVEAITFIADAQDCQEGLSTAVWYVSWMLYGLREHHADEDYIEYVRQRALETNRRAGVHSLNQNRLIEHL